MRASNGLRTVPRHVVRPDSPSVSVVVPARDEAATLPVLLRSLRALTTAPHEVVVVDDGSRDGTAAVARAGGATVVGVEGPPDGWTGKAWAADVGARASGGVLLLFLDADVELAPDALGGLLELHDRLGGLVSVQPYHRVERAYEQASAYCNVVSVLASAAFGPGPQRRPMAFGPCLLTSRADYERVGGHAAARADILDDVALATAYRRAGLPVSCAIGGGAVRMRMYPAGWRQLAEGWTKNMASGASAAPPVPTLATVAWVGVHHAVAAGTLRRLARPGRATSGWLVAWVAVAWPLRSGLRTLGSFRWWTSALFPVPLLAFDVLFARSVVLTLVHRSVRWRGRDVVLDREDRCSGS